MKAEPTQSNIAGLLGSLSRADIFARPSSAVLSGALRFEAGFYGSEGYRALQAMERSGFEIRRIGDLADVRWFGPFARTYVNDSEAGTPFLTSSTMLSAARGAEKFISKVLTNDLERLLVSDGTVLVSCSGTIGNITICTKDVDGYAVSQDAIRVDSKSKIDRGLIYVFLLSDLGRFLVTRNKSGSVIEHLYADDVESLPVPLFPKALRQELSDKIQWACDLRVKANGLLGEAELAVTRELALSVGRENTKTPAAFVSKSSQLFGERPYKGSIRLDATAHNPSVTAARAAIAGLNHGVLSDLVSEVLYIGKVYRNFVDDADQGVPLLSGKDLIELRHRANKYMSLIDTAHIKRCQLERGWVLVTRSGTIGRVSICHRNYEGYVGSEHILRLIPSDEKLDPYFLVAFLSSAAGQSQISALIYGSVVQTLSGAQLGSVLVPIPDDKGAEIGAIVRKAYDLRADAIGAENDAVHLFMTATERGKAAIEQEWGKEY